MARVFTTSFYFNGKSYTAVVSQLDGKMNIYVPDENLHSIIPNGKATFHPDQGMKIDRTLPVSLQDLLLNIIISIEVFLKESSKIKERKS
jgi:hypothetical protein